MTRDEILAWLREHQASIHDEPEAALASAEREARRRAAEDAWQHARAIAEEQIRYWSQRSHAMHAREDWVAREVCHELARELKHLEPRPADDVAHWLGPATLARFDREAREQLRAWIRDVAGQEEHRVWQDVVRFTDARARSLVREGELSTQDGWEYTHSYAETAARLAAILARDYEARAHSPAR